MKIGGSVSFMELEVLDIRQFIPTDLTSLILVNSFNETRS